MNPNVRPPPPGAPRPPPPVRPGSGPQPSGPGKDILQVVLDERLLSVTLRLEVNKFVK